MKLIISLILILIFSLLSLIHFYWAFGGKWGASAVIPTKTSQKKAIQPGPVASIIVAIGLAVLGALIAWKAGWIQLQLPYLVENFALLFIAVVFLIRAIGDFKYVGFFKKIKNTRFAKNDSRYFSPLCLLIGFSALALDAL
jgi:fatty acid desaturase